MQRSHNLWCYRRQLFSLHRMIKQVSIVNSVYNLLNLIIVFIVYLASEDVIKTTTI